MFATEVGRGENRGGEPEINWGLTWKKMCTGKGCCRLYD